MASELPALGAVSARFCSTEKGRAEGKHTSALDAENTACESPGGRAAASASSPQTPEAAVVTPETAAQASGLGPSDGFPVRAIRKASRVLVHSFVVGDIVVLDDSVGKEFRGQEAQVVKVLAKSVKVTMLQGMGKAKTKNFDHNVCKVVQPSTLRLKPGRQASSDVLSAVDAPATAQPSPGSAAQAPATPNVIRINDYDFEAEQLAKALGLGDDDSE